MVEHEFQDQYLSQRFDELCFAKLLDRKQIYFVVDWI